MNIIISLKNGYGSESVMHKNVDIIENEEYGINIYIFGEGTYFYPYRSFVSIFFEDVGDIEEESLEDLREGPFSNISLSDAVEKLMFELENDRSLYAGYKTNLSQIMSNRFHKEINVDNNPQVEESLRNICDLAATDFLDEFISLRVEE